MGSCLAIEQYCDRHSSECLPEDVAAYKNYMETRWSEDYGRPGFQLYYAYRLFRRRVVIAQEAFSKYLDNVNDGTMVVSIGCGPGPELAAAHQVLGWPWSVSFLGIDCEGGWERLYRAWTTRVPGQFYWHTEKITDQEMLVNILRATNASVVIFSYFVCDFGAYLNPRRLMERVPTLQQIFIFDRTAIGGIDDSPSTNELIYCYRPHGDSWKERVQVLVYSRREIIINTALGFAITLRFHGLGEPIYELALDAGHFKSVERSVASSLSYQYRMLIPFTAIHYGASFRDDFINLVAPRLVAAVNIPIVRAKKIVTDWSVDHMLGDDVDLDDVEDDLVSDLIQDLLALRDGEWMSSSWTFSWDYAKMCLS